METIRIKNFRSFIDTGEIAINKVNILLGQNSSGKSSFLNLFPMFKETTKNELRSPLMWFGEGTYDFGAYNNVHCRMAKKGEPVVFEFSWKSLQKKKGTRCENCGLFDRVQLGFMNANNYRISFSVNSDDKGDYLEEVVLYGDDHTARVKCSKSRSLSFFLDNHKKKSTPAVWDYGVEGILPNVRFKGKYSPINSIRRVINALIPENYQEPLKDVDYQKLYDIKSINPREIYSYYEQNKDDNPFMDFIVKAHKIDSEEFLQFCNNIYLSIIISSFVYADGYLSSTFDETSYMLPVRYAFGRYIRNKNLAVESIVPSGENVMEFLLSLSKKELEDFNILVEKVLQVTVSVEGDDNKSIYILSKTGKDNIVDVGYGFTQILPIVTMLWNIARKKSNCEFPNTVILEQPEVHLHPSLQGDVAKLIVEAMILAKNTDSNLQIFVETHSEAFVNRLGKYIRNNEAHQQDGISSNEVSVLLFEKGAQGSIITPTKFDSKGYIEKWPIGFLN